MKDVLTAQFATVNQLAGVNLAGVREDHSRAAPSSGGHCMNWVLGHLTDTYNSFLPVLGEEMVWADGQGRPYARGSQPLGEGEGLPWNELLAAWEAASTRFQQGLEAFDEARWSDKAPFSPLDDPDETMGSLLALLVFHQSYHVGQLGLLRRVAGLDTAVK